MSIVRPRLDNSGDRQAGPSTPNSAITYVMTPIVSTFATATKTVIDTTTTSVYVTSSTTTATVYITITPPPSFPVLQTITTTLTSIISTTKLETSLLTSPACASVVVDTTTVTSTIPTAAAVSAGPRPPLPDHSSTSQGIITGLAAALAAAVIIACLAWLFWRRRKGKTKRPSLPTRRSESFSALVPKGNGPWNSQSATPSNDLRSYTPELPVQMSVACGGFGSYFRVGRDNSSGVTYAPDSQTQTSNADGNEEFFPRSLSQCTEIGMAI